MPRLTRKSPVQKQLKTQNKPKASFEKLRSLKCYKAFYDRLLAGWPLHQLRDFIQKENQELGDMEPEVLVKELNKFRKSIPPGDFLSLTAPVDLVAQKAAPYHSKALEQIALGIDELEEMGKLYFLQMRRIERAVAQEENEGQLKSAINPEVRILKEILEASAKLKMDFGIQKRHLGIVETEARILKDVGDKYGNPAVVDAISDSQSRQRLADVVASVERLLLTDGKAADAADPALEHLLEQLAADPK